MLHSFSWLNDTLLNGYGTLCLSIHLLTGVCFRVAYVLTSLEYIYVGVELLVKLHV